jgi:hypothetical protein
LAAASTTACNAAGSMGFSAEGLGAEAVTVVMPGCDEPIGPIDVCEGAVVGPEMNEQLATRRATQVANPTIRLLRALLERRASLVLSPFSASETSMVGITT